MSRHDRSIIDSQLAAEWLARERLIAVGEYTLAHDPISAKEKRTRRQDKKEARKRKNE